MQSPSSTLLRTKIARVAHLRKRDYQCFQILENEVQYDSTPVCGRITRSTMLLSISMRPSARKRSNSVRQVRA